MELESSVEGTASGESFLLDTGFVKHCVITNFSFSTGKLLSLRVLS